MSARHELQKSSRELGTLESLYVALNFATPSGFATKLNALFAIDALGVGGMFRADTTIESSCRRCGTSIEIGTSQSGQALSYARPASAVVWYDLAYSQAAATSCCLSISFFCSDEHLQQWLAGQTTRRAGYRLAIDEALEVGRALFEPILAPAGVEIGDLLVAT